MEQISGMIMYPCSLDEQAHEEKWKNSEFFTDKNFLDEYQKHKIAMQHTAECAKIYITKHWKEIKDWSNIHVTVIHGPTGKKTEYFKYIGEYNKENVNSIRLNKGIEMSKIWDRWDEMEKKAHNPLISMDEVILDPTDGDFSITVNGGIEHWWIQDEAVIIIADYIEEQIKKNEFK
jgi:hypothetical protein